jgi:hypothetical protein
MIRGEESPGLHFGRPFLFSGDDKNDETNQGTREHDHAAGGLVENVPSVWQSGDKSIGPEHRGQVSGVQGNCCKKGSPQPRLAEIFSSPNVETHPKAQTCCEKCLKNLYGEGKARDIVDDTRSSSSQQRPAYALLPLLLRKIKVWFESKSEH